MHYKNGRAAKVGDMIVGKDINGLPVAGVVVKTLAHEGTCNLVVTPVREQLWYTAGECLHVDDVLPEAK